MTPDRSLMLILSTILGASAVKWLAERWCDASHERQGTAIGFGVAMLIFAVCALLRAVGMF